MRQRIRRRLAAVGAALLLGFQAFSALYVLHEADHACDGAGCQTCAQIQRCIADFQLTGPGIEADAACAPLPVIAAEPTAPAEVPPPSLTLVALKVQFNE